MSMEDHIYDPGVEHTAAGPSLLNIRGSLVIAQARLILEASDKDMEVTELLSKKAMGFVLGALANLSTTSSFMIPLPPRHLNKPN